jgi:hypothetical protein
VCLVRIAGWLFCLVIWSSVGVVLWAFRGDGVGSRLKRCMRDWKEFKWPEADGLFGGLHHRSSWGSCNRAGFNRNIMHLVFLITMNSA